MPRRRRRRGRGARISPVRSATAVPLMRDRCTTAAARHQRSRAVDALRLSTLPLPCFGRRRGIPAPSVVRCDAVSFAGLSRPVPSRSRGSRDARAAPSHGPTSAASSRRGHHRARASPDGCPRCRCRAT